MSSGSVRAPASFRDPSGYVFEHDGEVLRAVMPVFEQDFSRFVASGCYQALVDEGLLVAHDEIDPGVAPGAWKVLRPERVPFLSWPYEWSPGQRRAAALTTLRAQEVALDHGMTLRDASAFNVQFLGSGPVLIDTLSFGRLEEGAPWIGYAQFCRHFLAPLALQCLVDVRLGDLLTTNIDGIPLDLASRLLPARTRFRPGLMTHIHLQARARRRVQVDPGTPVRTATFSMKALQGLVVSLRGIVSRLTWEPRGTVWAEYYGEASHYTDAAMEHKVELVAAYLDTLAPRLVMDLGANTGRFSRLAAAQGACAVAADIDHGAVEAAWRSLATDPLPAGQLIPLRHDLANPSPPVGWANRERQTLVERGPADVVLALALVHHLAIANNVPLPDVIDHLARLGSHVVVEFVPKDDPKVQVLLATREDIFVEYTVEDFERVVQKRCEVLRRDQLRDSTRILYLLRVR